MSDMDIPVRYIDPGTSGAVFTSLSALIAAVLSVVSAFFIAYFIRPLKRLLSGFRRLFTMKKKTSYKLPLLIVIMAVFFAAFVLTSGDFYMVSGDSKVLVLGIDALDAELMEKMMDEGKLPNFSKLKDAGGYARLLSTIPPETPVAWSAAATGTNPGGYGIYDFVGRDAKTYLPKLNLAQLKSGITGPSYVSSMKGTPFWKITSDNGIQTTVIRWPVTFPPDKVKGNMLSGLGVVDLKGYLSSYSFYTSSSGGTENVETGNVVNVTIENGKISTAVYGPVARAGSSSSEVQVPMTVKIGEDKISIEISKKRYDVEVGGWSEWMEAEFSVGMLRKVKGIFKVYVNSAEPFSMYMTTVQIHPKDPVFDISYPKGYAGELADRIGLYHTLGMPEETKPVTEGVISEETFLQQVNQIEEERTKMFWHEFSRFESGVLAFAFDSGDRLQHIFWNSGSMKEVEEYYIEKDRMLGEILGKIDEDTKLLIFSDHGFGTFNRSVNINMWLVKNGYMTLTKNVTEDDNGELFKYVDWGKTKAYALGFSSIYINLEGREGNGIVRPEEKDKLVDEIINKLTGLEDENGKSVITNLYVSDKIYTGKFAGDAPDIVMGFSDGYRMSWQGAVGGATPWIFKDNEAKWRGDHLIDRSHVPGVAFANFRMNGDGAEITGIAPTVLELTGMEIPKDMEGKSLWLHERNG